MRSLSAPHVPAGATEYETAVRVYGGATADGGEHAVFSQRWPAGARDTALGPAAVPGGPQEEVISAFPSISPTEEEDQSYLVVWNQMVRAIPF